MPNEERRLARRYIMKRNTSSAHNDSIANLPLRLKVDRERHPWKDALAFNPAHPPSHLHINQTPLDEYESLRDAGTHSPAELRLTVGVPNPLALILSVAAWKRRM
ncbi:MAG: hypothetical protein O3A00_06255 [Planctomycetota bacterium]|nr:hypothetical protein [Planctomycetota bacterium]